MQFGGASLGYGGVTRSLFVHADGSNMGALDVFEE
jgi:hypothetical protein